MINYTTPDVPCIAPVAIIAILFTLLQSPVHALTPASNIEDTDHGNSDWVISADTTIAGKHFNLGNFQIDAGVIVTVKGSTVTSAPYNGARFGGVRIFASTITINGTLSADGSGHIGGTGTAGSGKGPGAGIGSGMNQWGAGGGGYGGPGGWGRDDVGNPNGAGGPVYGSTGLATSPVSLDDIEPGSGGGGARSNISCPTDGTGGSGGGYIFLEAPRIVVGGTVTANGGQEAGGASGVGGGSGGGALLNGDIVTISTISAKGTKGNRVLADAILVVAVVADVLCFAGSIQCPVSLLM